MDQLNKLANDSDVQGLILPAHLYICDYMIIKYSPGAIMNVIRSGVSKIQKGRREYKHFTPLYWYKVVDNILGKNQTSDIQIFGEMQDYNSFNYLVKNYLQSDYSGLEAQRINHLVNTVDQSVIVSACKIAIQNGVRNIAYVESVIASEQQKKKFEDLRLKVINDRAQESSNLLKIEVQTHTPIEMAQIEYKYEQKREDILLELMVKRLLEGKK
jgi:hypothetical protein